MFVIGNLLISLGMVLNIIIVTFQILLIARAVLSWVNPDPYNPLVRFITSATDPLIYRVRRWVPPLGMFDLSVLILLLGLIFLDNFLVASMVEGGRRLLRSDYSAPVERGYGEF